VAATALAVLPAACTNTESARTKQPVSGSASASLVNGVQQVRLDVGDDYRFHPALITVNQGRVRVVLRHTGTGAPHDWQLTRYPKDYVPTVNPGQTLSSTFTTPAPGSYRFVCTIHVQQGQVGTMVVRPPAGG
jgi:plastocyanin